jgi:hypothetical protein
MRRSPQNRWVRLSKQVTDLCDDVITRLEPSRERESVKTVRAKLDEPLRLAFVGSVSAGKSTLVNAFLGQKIAAVDVGECTRIVTWFRYHFHERVEVHLRSGQRWTQPLDPGPQLPTTFGVDPSEIARVVVWLSNERLKDISIADTPGGNTPTRANEAATLDMLGLRDLSAPGQDSRLAMSEADGLILLMPHIRKADTGILTSFRTLYRGLGLSAVNVVGVLSKIDRLTSADEDPWEAGYRIARRGAELLQPFLVDMIPVIGLLAETANTDQFDESDAQALARVARLNESDREDALVGADDFLHLDPAGLPAATRQRLLAMLDLYGLRISLEAIDGGGSGAAALLENLAAASGFAPLEAVIDDVFARRADLLKAYAAVTTLQRIAQAPTESNNARYLRQLRDPLERLELDPAMGDLRAIDALRWVCSDEMQLDEDLLADIRRLSLAPTPAARLGLTAGASPRAVRMAAAETAARWRSFAYDNRRTPFEGRVARDVAESFESYFYEGDDDAAEMT